MPLPRRQGREALWGGGRRLPLTYASQAQKQGGWVGRGRAQGSGTFTNSPGATPRSSPTPRAPRVGFCPPTPGLGASDGRGHYAEPLLP